MRQNGKDITPVTQYSLLSSPHIQTSVTCGLLVASQGLWVYICMCGLMDSRCVWMSEGV